MADKRENLIVEIIAKTKQFRSGMGRALGALKSFANPALGIFKAVTKVVAGLVAGVAALGVGLGALLNKVATVGDDFAKMAKRTGLSIGFLSAMDYAAQRAGASITDIQTAIRGLGRVLVQSDQESKQTVDILTKLGVQLRDANGAARDVKDIFLDVMRALKKLPSVEKVGIAQLLFGRGGMNLIPLLNENLDALIARAKFLGVTWTQTTGQMAERFKDSMLDIKMAIWGIILAVFRPALGSASAGLKTIADAIARFRINVIEPLAPAIRQAASDATAWLISKIPTIQKWLTGTSDFLKKTLPAAIDKTKKTVKDFVAWWLATGWPGIKGTLEALTKLVKMLEKANSIATKIGLTRKEQARWWFGPTPLGAFAAAGQGAWHWWQNQAKRPDAVTGAAPGAYRGAAPAVVVNNAGVLDDTFVNTRLVPAIQRAIQLGQLNVARRM